MTAFFAAYAFWKYNVLAVVLAGGLLGYLGVYVVLRRVVFVGAALTQVSGVGIAFAFWLGSFYGSNPHDVKHWWLAPQLYSLVAAVAGAILFSFNRDGRRLASETIVGLGWVIAGASLLLVMSSNRIAAEKHEVDDLLYGNDVLVTAAQVRVLASVAAALMAVHIASFKEFVFVSYDADMARTLHYRTWFWDGLLFATFGVGISLAVRFIGSLPAFGFLVIPAASAQLLVRRVKWAFPLAVVFAMAGGALGYYLAFTRQWPTGAAIVAASALFLVPGLVRRALWRDQ